MIRLRYYNKRHASISFQNNVTTRSALLPRYGCFFNYTRTECYIQVGYRRNMISSKQADEPKTCGTEDVMLSTEPNLNGDWSNFFLLTLMYTMQGFCFGVNIAISLLLKGRHDGTYNEQVPITKRQRREI